MRETLKTTPAGQLNVAVPSSYTRSEKKKKNVLEEKQILRLEIIDSNTCPKGYPPEPQQAHFIVFLSFKPIILSGPERAT